MCPVSASLWALRLPNPLEAPLIRMVVDVGVLLGEVRCGLR
jgi:hypothetical protein